MSGAFSFIEAIALFGAALGVDSCKEARYRARRKEAEEHAAAVAKVASKEVRDEWFKVQFNLFNARHEAKSQIQDEFHCYYYQARSIWFAHHLDELKIPYNQLQVDDLTGWYMDQMNRKYYKEDLNRLGYDV